MDLTAEQNETVLKKTDMCFMFAPVYHSSMRYAAPVRKELGVRTVFNILGPSVQSGGRQNAASRCLRQRSCTGSGLRFFPILVLLAAWLSAAMTDWMRITLTGKTYVNEIRNGEIISYTITPEQFGLKSCELSELIGGTPKENAEITRRILTGEETGPKRDVILMNAGMSLYLGIDGITLAEGIEKAKEMIDSGKAYSKLQEFVKATQEA